MSVRVRFAPSPTGHLHIGGVRTALFNYLFAKANSGQFILRIEDTDTERSNNIYTEDILKSLQWLGLNWDEGPIFQSQHFERYKEVAESLVRGQAAYFCDCTPELLDEERKALEAQGKKPMYGGRCREKGLSSGVIRFKTPKQGVTSFEDLIRGTISVQNQEIEDFILLRNNKTPTYNLACVVDDFDGKMSHIVRGDDHINNTPKQVLIFDALKYKTPLYAHLPMILGTDKKKLSKRHGAVSANVYRTDGFLPEAVVNYLARLGWSHGDQEIFSIEELIRYFSLEKIGKSGAVFNTEKLLWLNGHYIRAAKDERLAKLLFEDFSEVLNEYGKISALKERLSSEDGLGVIFLTKQKVKTLKEMAVLIRPFVFDGPLPLDEAIAVGWTKNTLSGPIEHVISEIKHLVESKASANKGIDKTIAECGVDVKTLETLFRATADRYQMKLVELAQPTRFLLQGVTVGPSLFDFMSRFSFRAIESRLRAYEQAFK
ncbi:MAG: glutamate--tRNA ligase [Bacteriovoracia bacterium]